MPHKEDARIRILTGVYERLAMPQDKVCELDLGCGTGSFSVALAASYPERFIICADVMLGRLRKVVRRSNHQSVENLEVLRVEARHLLGIMMPDASLDRIRLSLFILTLSIFLCGDHYDAVCSTHAVD